MKSFLGFLDDPRPPVLTPTLQVRLELRSRPGVYLTKARLADLTGLTLTQVASAIEKLTKQRKIIRRVDTTRGVGRNSGQAYQWLDYPGRGRELRSGGPSRAGTATRAR